MDVLQGRSESQVLDKICKLIGHEVASFQVHSATEFHSVCEYISSIADYHDSQDGSQVPLCVHIATHGNENGLGIGKQILSWTELANAILPICTEMKAYKGETVFVISACGAGQQRLTSELAKQSKQKSGFVAPKYVFVTEDQEVYWSDAALSWAMFYHQLPRISLNKKVEVQGILNRIKVSKTGNLKYYRWDEKKKQYLHYSGRDNA
jgi:hypothetical protein